MTAPLVSFVIPNYNHARYVHFAVDSALTQTHPQVEVIVVDDGSTDDSRSVLEAYGDRIRAIFQANTGLPGARNAGIAAARGEYIALLDADDTLEPTYVERLLHKLAHSPGSDGTYCGFRFVDEDDLPLGGVENRLCEPDVLYAALLNGNFWVPESLLARRACYAAMGEFDRGLSACEDWDVWLRFSRHYTLVGIPDVLIRYRVLAGSMSSNPKRMLTNRLAVLARHIGVAPSSAGTSAAHHAYASAYLRTAIEHLAANDQEASYCCLVEAAKIYPSLLVESATYYELACGSQPRGENSGLDLAARQSELRALLARLAADAALPVDSAPVGAWQARLLWAIAQLHYRAGAADAARSALLQSFRFDPGLMRDAAWRGLLLRALVGKERTALLKRLAGARVV